MTKYREILRLSALGLSLRNIERSLNVSQHTIIKDTKRCPDTRSAAQRSGHAPLAQ